MQHIAVLMALETEAKPAVAALGLSEPSAFGAPMPFLRHQGVVGQTTIDLITLGRDPATQVQLVGTQPAAVACDRICRELKPDLVINAGTAGGFVKRGGAIGTLYLTDGPFHFHDRRIALPGYGAYGEGGYHTPTHPPRAEKLRQTLGFLPGPCTTGDSLDLVEADAQRIERFGAVAKDMEAAAIAWVCTQHQVPLLALKSITDLVDGPHATEVEFLKNLETASKQLGEGLTRLLQTLAAE